MKKNQIIPAYIELNFFENKLLTNRLLLFTLVVSLFSKFDNITMFLKPFTLDIKIVLDVRKQFVVIYAIVVR